MTFDNRILSSTDVVTEMAKRRYKNKARRVFVGLNRKVNVNGQELNKCENMDEIDAVSEGIENISDDPEVKVQVTENKKIYSGVTESGKNGLKLTELSQNKVNKIKRRKSDGLNGHKKEMLDSDGTGEDEVLIFPIEMNGETCIDVQCGPNEAYMYLSKLCVGSRGACIQFLDKWLTPNEFQLVSGRETAKDWKRSIRHKGRSLKLLIGKGLITVQSISPKKAAAAAAKAEKKAAPKVTGGDGGNEVTKETLATKAATEPQIRVSSCANISIRLRCSGLYPKRAANKTVLLIVGIMKSINYQRTLT